MRKFVTATLACMVCCGSFGQRDSVAQPDKSALRYNLSDNGNRFFQVTFVNQVWLRYNQSNEGTTVFGRRAPETGDIGLRRTRIAMFGQITDRAFVYFQFGQNNFNNTAGYVAPTASNPNPSSTNRKAAAFFHDALCELRVGKGNTLKVGGGLTVMNALSRFSQPSVSSIMTLDLPVFLQFTVDQTDQFDRRLAAYARGQVSKLDYRVYVSNPFPVVTNGLAAPSIGKTATYYNPLQSGVVGGHGIHKQYGGYFVWNFFEMEPHTTAYMAGTYLGTKKVFNIAAGAVYQQDATWHLQRDATGAYTDTTYNNMMHVSIESFLDVPLSKERGTALSAFAGYYNFNYGYKYLRYNGNMNPATGSTATNIVQSTAYGNAFPMFGTGQVVYVQAGYVLPKSLIGARNGQLMPYASAQYADYMALQNKPMIIADAGMNWLIKGHNAKISIDYQNRPTYVMDANSDVKYGLRKSCVILCYQIFI